MLMPVANCPSILRSVEAVGAGAIVMVSDSEARENEADLVMAAPYAEAGPIGFMVRHTGGLLCVPMSADLAEHLGLPPMVDANSDLHRTAFTVSVDHRSTGTGISATDRSATIRALADRGTTASDLRRPGHVFPLVARTGGVIKRAGHTEAAIELCQLAGLPPVAVISELVSDTGEPLKPAEAADFARRHRLPHITIEQLQRHQRSRVSLLTQRGGSSLPTRHGIFQAHAYRSSFDDIDHLALTLGDVRSARGGPVLVRVHSECLTGDVLGSRRCDCGQQLDQALGFIAREGRGVLVYLRGQEGRGIGLAHKLRAYSLQDRGRDTVDANLELGLPVDSRDYGVGAHILADLGVREIRLLTNNPAKYSGLAAYSLTIVERVPLLVTPTADSLSYLATKQRRLGHHLTLEPNDMRRAHDVG
jgi:3,4-dihydroxy 2-butanone 4-phosphate synthase / GTP cyclohydrolase II